MFAIFGLGLGEILVIALIGSVLFFVYFTVARGLWRLAHEGRVTIRNLRDELEDLRRENEKLREQIDRLRGTPTAPPVSPTETGIKQSDA